MMVTLAAVFLFACNNETTTEQAPTADTTHTDSSITTPPIVDSTPADRTKTEPAVDTVAAQFQQKAARRQKPQGKLVSKRAKLDSVALRQNKDLPLGKDN